MKKAAFLLLILVALVGVACGAAATQAPLEEPAVERQSKASEEYGYDADMAAGSSAPPPAPGSVGANGVAQEGRMVIRTAYLSLVVDDVETSLPKVLEMVGKMEGYVVSSSSSRTYSNRLMATVVLRVPEQRFLEAMAELRQYGEVQSESLSGEDVTDQYIDLEARLNVREATEAELLALLAEVREGSGTADEKAEAILAIYNQLTAVRTEIEQIRGRMQYLEQMAAMATITVELYPREPETGDPVPTDTFDPLRTLRQAGQALVDVLEWLVNAAIWVLIVMAPIGALVFLPAFLIVRGMRRRKRGSKPQP